MHRPAGLIHRRASETRSDPQEEAIRRIEPAHNERDEWFAPFGFVRYVDEQGRT